MPKKIKKITKTTNTRKVAKRHPKHFLKVYWPYVPIIAVVVFGMVFGNVSPHAKKNNPATLAYATEMSITQLLNSTNEQRVNNGLKPLKINAVLNSSAQAKANNMEADDYWAHNTPDGEEPWVFFDAAGYKYQKAGENLAYGFDTSSATVVGWMNSPSHRANILDSSYLEVGFGFVKSENFVSTGNETIVVAHYARPLVIKETTNTVATATPTKDTGIILPASTDKKETETVKKTKEPTKEESKSENSGQAITSENPVPSSFASTNITRLQRLTNGKAPWSALALSVVSFIIVGAWLMKHVVLVKKYLLKSENFAAHHPMLDLAVVTVTALAVYLSQSSGVVL